MSALVCDRNPKVVSAEVGHTTLRMVIEKYDSFIDPANWPDDKEIARLKSTYGWAKRARSLPEPSLNMTHAHYQTKTPPR